jgi:cytochrome b subunit of formate dehydrogenase
MNPDNYLFYGGDAPHVPYLQQYIDNTAITVVRRIFFIGTILMVLFMIATILGELVRWWLNYGRKNKPYNALPGSPDETQIVRFKNPFMLWHYAVMIGFILAGIIGLMQAFPDWGPGQAFFDNLGLHEVRNFHHYFAYIIDGTLLLVIAYYFYKFVIKKERMRAMLPTFKDIMDAINMNLYILGLKKHEPQYGRYTFGQKIDFILVIVGIPILSVTGLTMHYTWLVEWAIGEVGIAMLVIIHRSMALFLTWFIISVHFYYAHLAPGFFPVNTVILTGKMPVSRYRALYPLDAERVLMQEIKSPADKKDNQ